MKQGIIIAIDGPVASGKGTIAPLLARKLQGFYLHTGAMYRCVAYYCLEHTITEEVAVVAALPKIKINFEGNKTFLNGEDVTEKLEQNIVSIKVAWVAAIKEVRSELISQQQRIGKEKVEQGITVIAEGRDTGTVVFPDAQLKIFLDASLEARSKRRLHQLQIKGESVQYAQVLSDTKKRDDSDQMKSGALVTDPKKHGYSIIESTGMTEEDTLGKIITLLEERHIQ